jgi:hypothetical protein
MLDAEIRDGKIVSVNGEKVKRIIKLGSGAQYDVFLVTSDASSYIVEAGISARGQYVEVLTRIDELSHELKEKLQL